MLASPRRVRSDPFIPFNAVTALVFTNLVSAIVALRGKTIYTYCGKRLTLSKPLQAAYVIFKDFMYGLLASSPGPTVASTHDTTPY